LLSTTTPGRTSAATSARRRWLTDREDDALAKPHARPMDFTGRPMGGFVTVQPEGRKGAQLNRWVREAESLPSK